jgi:hypothetical protein
MLFDRVEQGSGLQPVAAGPPAGLLDDPARVEGRLDRGDHELDPGLGHPPVAVLDHLSEVMAGVHVHDREGDPGGREGPLRQGEHDDRVLAAGKEQDRPLELGGHLPHHVNRLGFEYLELGQRVVRAHHGHQG